MRQATSGPVRSTAASSIYSTGVIDKLYGKRGDVVLCEFNVASTEAAHQVAALQARIVWDKSKAAFLGFYDEFVWGGMTFEVAVSAIPDAINGTVPKLTMNTGHSAWIAPFQADDWNDPSRVCAVVVCNISNPRVPLSGGLVENGALTGNPLSFWAKFELLEDIDPAHPLDIIGEMMMGATGEALSLHCQVQEFNGENVLVYSR